MPDLRPFTSFSEYALAELDEWHNQGRPIAGVYCIYAPTELIRAAGAAPISLCGKKQDPIREAEKDLPAAFCPLIKSSYGYAVTETCPFFSFSDIIIAETTCDGKKKMYELMGEIKPLHLMHLPHTQSGEAALTYWLNGLRELEKFLCEYSGITVTEEALHAEIVLQNRIRKELYELMVLTADKRSPLSAKEILAVQECKSFSVHPENYLEKIIKLKAELEEFYKQPDLNEKEGIRILLTGCPVGKGSEKVITVTEELGAHVVCMENCSGLKGLTLPIAETGDPYEAIARRYLQVPCSCMTPNRGRTDSISELSKTFNVDAVIDLTWIGCHTYNAESTIIRRFVENELELPFLHIETDYSESDVEQLRTRIEAFIELAE
ncbi:double-cubane-cluster-containing anaerobic reductase [Maridesulfovibrio sp.]|uniref:double-cubane-cluster-containing anaerobic reductase n=1 Tax=Maridesulfovibrio sp. TaxID=2795000 RepID=UPI002A18B74B|nr:double-cubane-cluster-containing anaerobic reductase [Maridesulfovibrio sp.]